MRLTFFELPLVVPIPCNRLPELAFAILLIARVITLIFSVFVSRRLKYSIAIAFTINKEPLECGPI